MKQIIGIKEGKALPHLKGKKLKILKTELFIFCHNLISSCIPNSENGTALTQCHPSLLPSLSLCIQHP